MMIADARLGLTVCPCRGRRCRVRFQPQTAPRTNNVRRQSLHLVGAVASTQTHQNGLSHQEKAQALRSSTHADLASSGLVEMFVATTVKPGQKSSSAVRKMVPPPRQNGIPAVQQHQSKQSVAPAMPEAASLAQQREAAHNRAVRAELASVTSQLQTKNSQLSRADAALRQRDSEIAALRATLSERDSKLQDSRSELAELHLQVKSHEEGLQQAYNQLAEASKDKARVRQQLLENQAELTGVHTQLTEWSQDLHQLKSIMDTLEEGDQLIDQPLLSGGRQPSSAQSSESNGSADAGKGLHELTAEVSEKTDAALSATGQTPQDGMALLEGIANLSKQMVGEAQEDVELFHRAGRGANDEQRQK